MSILSALYTGVSGLNANGQWLSVIGDNIANVNTIGFKGSVMSFGDILSQSFAGGSGTSQIGRGVTIEGVTTVFDQGTFQTTSSGLDLAIDGEGFFIVNSAGTRAYTRAGNFKINDEGYIVNSSGAFLQGIQYDNGVQGAFGNINVLTGTNEAQQTTTAAMEVNLDSTDTPTTWTNIPVAGSTTPPATTTYNESTSVTVYDSLGGAHQVTAYFTNISTTANPRTWEVHYVYTTTDSVTGVTTYYQANATAQTLVFNANGALTSGNAATGSFNWGGGLTNSIAFDLTGSTQFASDFSIQSLTQNGYASGDLSSISIGPDGLVTGTFTNGQTRTLAQIQLARFAAPTELQKLGNNLFAASGSSGDAVIGNPETSGLGRTLSSSLELSTVDLAEQFTQLITAQRGFQANTKIITTTDDLLNLLISIKQ
jgi:flagellar hook protein FlgE